jgi:[glutamine synthetase] adenylyltransferase / [glutamine synthetase]-adenylyl-L-tyrosine phosphorylase
MADEDVLTRLFSDPARAAGTLHALEELYLFAGTVRPLEDFQQALQTRLALAPSPDRALTQLSRFVEASPSKVTLLDDLAAYPVLLDTLIRVFGTSAFFSDILVRDPGLFRWLTASDVLTLPLTRGVLDAEVARVEGMFKSRQKVLDSLRRFHRRQILRIGVRDILGLAALRETTRDLSLLADVMVDAVLKVARSMLGDPPDGTGPLAMAVIGLGKLGGGELNYSSDIDLLFVYADEQPAPAGRGHRRSAAASHAGEAVAEYANRLAERTVQILSEASAEGYFYRVDVRLRPESGAGPVALPLARYMNYYETRGELWERQMLIKGRCVAGDRALGDHFFRQLEPFVYPRTFFADPFGSIVRLKARIEAAADDPWNIKTMRGGIRDIEFSVQALQLLNGGKVPEVRKGGTLDAIGALRAQDLLTADEATAMASAYEFYRTLEHRLQTRLNTQTHTVPEDHGERTMLARMMGLKSAEELLRTIRDHQTVVRGAFEHILKGKGGAEEATLATMFETGAPEATQREVLRRFGFADPANAMKQLRVLMTGSSLGVTGDLDTRTREAFRAVAPALLSDISRTPDPDLTLSGVSAFLAGRPDTGQMYVQLQAAQFRKLVIDVCSRSPRLARALGRRPLLLDAIASNPGAQLTPFAGWPPASDPLPSRKEQAETVAGLRFLLGLSSIDAFTDDLSAIADAVIAEVINDESRRSKCAAPPLAVIALGKLGSRELMMDADVDLLFLSDTSRWKRKPAALASFAQSVVTRLAEVTPEGRLYEVDTRLRPEGRNAPLVTDAAAFIRYLAGRASLWERQTMTRFRWIAGDPSVVETIRHELHALVYEAPLPPGWVGTILKMRQSMESRIRTRGPAPVDLKLGRGGLVDIEFLVQMALLRNGSAGDALHALPVLSALPSLSGLPPFVPDPALTSVRATVSTPGEAAMSAKDSPPLPGSVPDPAAAARLSDCYRHLRTAQAYMRLTLEDRGNLLPDGAQLERLARVHTGAHAEEYRAHVLSRMDEVRKIADTAARTLAGEEKR